MIGGIMTCDPWADVISRWPPSGEQTSQWGIFVQSTNDETSWDISTRKHQEVDLFFSFCLILFYYVPLLSLWEEIFEG